MVGIVIVSHSGALADGLKVLADEMGKGKIKVSAAGGVDDPKNPIGTDAMKILNAINEVYSNDGVLVFMDMGSAILSAETAVDFLDEEQKKRVYLCEAPIVEGTIAAVVSAASGSKIDQVISEARTSILPKASQLGVEPVAKPDTSDQSEHDEHEGDEFRKRLTLKNTMGLHARPAAMLVGIASSYEASVKVRNETSGGPFVSGKSINQLIALKAGQYDVIEVKTKGRQAREVLSEIEYQVEKSFGESVKPAPKKKSKSVSKMDKDGVIRGIPISGGIAIGPVMRFDVELPEIRSRKVTNTENEITILKTALEKARREIESLKKESLKTVEKNEAAIFDAHLLMLSDPELMAKVHHRIKAYKEDAAAAWKTGLDEIIRNFRTGTSGEALTSRIIDLTDIGIRVLEHITGDKYRIFTPKKPVILLCNDLAPSDVASIDRSKILGICCTEGSELSHSAILARSIGIPTVFGAGEEADALENDHKIIVDGNEGYVYTRPTPAVLNEMEKRKSQWVKLRNQAYEQRKEQAQTADGKQVGVYANVANLEEIKKAVNDGAEGVGLFRTEFVFMGRHQAPNEDEQYRVYAEAAKVLQGKPLVIRTIDIGGDKPVGYLNMDPEDNPFLGFRGIRLTLNRPELFKTQISAILRASVHGRVSIMFPMVSTADEFFQCMVLYRSAKRGLDKRNIRYDPTVKVGIMLEVPSMVYDLDLVLDELDFVSIGTNDLTQYVMAADRLNPHVSYLADYHQPALLKLLSESIKKVKDSGTQISMCGEMAGDTRIMPLLLAWGLESFSMNSTVIPEFKWILRRQNASHYNPVNTKALKCTQTSEVKSLLKDHLADLR